MNKAKRRLWNVGVKRRLMKVATVAAICTFSLGLLVLVVSYLSRPRISFTVKSVDCSIEAKASRNKAQNIHPDSPDEKACDIVITATNNKNTYQSIDWEGVGGGFLAGFHPPVTILDTEGGFCNAVAFEGQSGSFKPNETRNLQFTCFDIANPSDNYNKHADSRPATITFKLEDSFTTVRLSLR